MSPTPPRSANDHPSALPAGTRLGEFELLSLLGVGGFGIVYLAFDHALEREVAVKEYMPASLAGRTETLQVSLRSQSDADTFALGLRSFVNEAKMLARFDHQSLLKVHRFWEANGTAYMAMPVMRGQTLKEVRAAMGHAPTEAWLRELLTPLLGAIEKLHSEGVYHRDIAPDNIQIDPEGRPVLLDFGAARRVIGDKSQTLTAILKPAYAPIEQYAEAGSVKQGPWTDIYALGATLHYLLLNRPPPPATARAIHDEASALSVQQCAGCSEDFLRTIDWMLAPRPADRPQSVAALREVLEGHAAPPLRRVDNAPQVSQWDRTVVVGAKAAAPASAARPDASGLLDLDLDATRIVPKPTPTATPTETPTPTSTSTATSTATATATSTATPISAPTPTPPTAAPPGGRRWMPAALGLGAVAVVAAAFALWPRGAAVPAVDLAASTPSVAVAASAPAEVNTALPTVTTVPESAVATVVVPSTPPAAPARAPATAARAPVTPQVTSAPAPELPRAEATVPAAPAASPPQTNVAPPVALPRPAVASGPEAVCEGRNPMLYFVCMERECLRSRFQSHNDCVKWRKEARPETN